MVTQNKPKIQHIQFHNPNRRLPTLDIKANLEYWLWYRTEIDADLEADPTSWEGGEANLDFCDVQIALLVEELDRRERLRHRPGSPPWPMGSLNLGPVKDRVKAVLTIEEYLERRGVVFNRYRSGRAVTFCMLPGHDDSSASFSVNTEKRVFYCHGCNRGGDVLNLHMHLIGDTDFVRTVRELATEAGIDAEVRHAS